MMMFTEISSMAWMQEQATTNQIKVKKRKINGPN
jgi:hypothetical protein